MLEKPITETIQAPHIFSDVEKLRLAQHLADSLRNEEQIEQQFASVKSEFKGRSEKASLETGDFAQKVRDGFEMRPCVAIVTFNWPEKGRKTYSREDTGAFVREEAMTYGDQQRPLPLDDAASNQNGTKAENGRTGKDNHLPEAHEQAPAITPVQSPDVPPEGFGLVTDGASRIGDFLWSDLGRDWESMHDDLAGLDHIAFRALARPLNADAGITPVGEVIEEARGHGDPLPTGLEPEKKKRKPREKFTQPPGTVNVAGKEEHYLILDLSAVETEAGIRSEFKVAYRRAKWDRLSVGEVVKLLDGLPIEGMKSVLSLYTYLPNTDSGGLAE